MKKILQTVLFVYGSFYSYSQDCKFWPVFDPITRTASIPFGNSITFNNNNFTGPQSYDVINPGNWFTPDPSITTTTPPNSTPHNVNDLGVFSIFPVRTGETGTISFNSATTTGFYLHVVQTVSRIDFDHPFTLISSDGQINVSGNAIIPTVGAGESPDDANATLFFNAGVTTLRYTLTASTSIFQNSDGLRFAFTFPDNCMLTFYKDADGDNFGDPNNTVFATTAPPGYVTNNSDCNDIDNTVYPGAAERCDGKDNDCNGKIDENIFLLQTFFRDFDGDGFGDPAVRTTSCSAPTGYVTNRTDCNDLDRDIYPNAPELCDSKDNDCNGQIDEGVQTIFYRDADNDGWGDHLNSIQACTAPASYITIGGDCNDQDGNIYPNAPELCDSKDNNCNGQIDEGVLQTFYRDFDGDGFGDPVVRTSDCSAPPGYVTNRLDCNDLARDIYPNAPELCDSKDNDCNGQIDEGVQTSFYPDADNDGWGSYVGGIQACSAPPGFTTIGGDCNDQDRDIYPNAPELCDRKDNNCDGEIDEGVQTVFYRDADNDGYGNRFVTLQACARPQGYSDNNTDCDDGNAAIHPGAVEICKNLADENCDGQIGEGCSENPFITITDTTVSESQGFANIIVNLSKKSTKTIEVNYKTVNQQATSPADYIATTGTLTIPAGSQFGTITVIILTDNIFEQTEDFSVVLGKPKHAKISVGTCIVMIRDGTRQGSTPQGTSPEVQSRSAKIAQPVDSEQKLHVMAMPNPTANQFTLVTQSGNSRPIVIRVLDNYGRVVETRNNVAANGTYIIGHKYRPGIYYVEIIQEKNKTITKLIKQPY